MLKHFTEKKLRRPIRGDKRILQSILRFFRKVGV